MLLIPADIVVVDVASVASLSLSLCARLSSDFADILPRPGFSQEPCLILGGRAHGFRGLERLFG